MVDNLKFGKEKKNKLKESFQLNYANVKES